ncbi:ATP-binding protein [Flavobacterium sediminis]|uniref:histidine kinase n=1 Tax=Flavobacterium sediminis TaxID=2201181 RepID=A0A2U8QW87_9FLAO|nr:tetratricopeptide repeat-containing sensor histidine kinase [Flavobacterium sediminis]AWM14164.1 ATP-binding protein [Flavobacterium sediminis]
MIFRKIFSPIFFIILGLSLNSCDNKTFGLEEYERAKEKGEAFFDEEKYDSAFYYYNKAQFHCKEVASDSIIYPLLMMSEIQMIYCDFSGSETTLTEALPYVTGKTLEKYRTFIYNSLGLDYLEQKNFEEALKYYNKSFAITTNELSKCIIKNNIAYNYLEQEKYDIAREILDSIRNNNALVYGSKQYAKVIDNLGFAYFKEGNTNKAYHYLVESLQIRDSLGESHEKIASLMHLARFYQDSLTELTVDYAEKAYQAASNVKSPDDQIEALGILISNTTGTQSKEYFQKFMTTKDSIDLVRQMDKNQFAKIKYDYSLISKDAEIQKTQKIIYLLLVFIVLLSSLYIFFHIKRKNKIKLQLENQKTAYETETRISRKLHDELANDVFQTLSFVQTQDLDKNRASLVNDLDEIYKKTRNISRENNDIVTGKDFEADLVAMISDFQDKEVRIIIKKEEVNLDQISPEKQIAVYRVLRELLVNMKKYSQASLVVLNFSSDKELKVNYSDNGIGFEKKNVKGGIQSAENRIHSVNGTITFDTMPGKGLKVSIVIPKN